MSILGFLTGAAHGTGPSGTDRRRHRRIAVALSGTLSGSGESDAVWVGDLADGGAMVETALPLEVGERLTLSIDGWPPVAVVVRWTDGDRAGLAFDR